MTNVNYSVFGARILPERGQDHESCETEAAIPLNRGQRGISSKQGKTSLLGTTHFLWPLSPLLAVSSGKRREYIHGRSRRPASRGTRTSMCIVGSTAALWLRNPCFASASSPTIPGGAFAHTECPQDIQYRLTPAAGVSSRNSQYRFRRWFYGMRVSSYE